MLLRIQLRSRSNNFTPKVPGHSSKSDLNRFKDTASVIHLEGRTFPVDIFYLKSPCPDYMKESLETVMKIHKKNEPGDILVFLTSAEDCDSLTETLEEKSAELSRRAQEVGVRMNKMKVYRLYGSLPVQDQMKVFENKSSSLNPLHID